MNDDPYLPRLPATNPPVPPSATWQADDAPIERVTVDLEASIVWVDYEEPDLLPLTRASWFVTAARIGMLIWAIVVVVFAGITSSTAGRRPVDTGVISTLANVGIAATLVLAVAGWYWSDRVTRNVHRLEARLPSRLRSVTAWASPVVWALLLTVTVLRAESSGSIDVRPLIVTPIFAAAFWRPFALMRRMLKSLIRVDSDLLITACYALDLGAFGVMWWRLSSLPETASVANVGEFDALFGLGAVAAFSFGLNVVVWEVLRRDMKRAVAHRRVALRTRHDHRQLRAHGIDPMDGEVRAALAEVGREGLEAAGVIPSAADLHPVLPDVEPQVVDQPAWVEREENRSRVLRESFPETSSPQVPEAPSPQATEAPSPEVPEHEAIPVLPDVLDVALNGGVDAGSAPDVAEHPTDEAAVDPTVDADADADALDSLDLDSLDLAASRDESPGGVEPNAEGELLEVEVSDTPVEDEAVDDVAAAADVTADNEEAQTVSIGVPAETGPGIHDRVAQAIEQSELSRDVERRPALLDRLADRARALQANTEQSDPLETLLSRSGALQGVDAGASILSRLERLGISADPDAPLAAPGITTGGHDFEADDTTGDATLTNRVYGLEFFRYLMLFGFAAALASSVWWVIRSVSLANLVRDDPNSGAIQSLETARQVAVLTLMTSLGLVALWVAGAVQYAKRFGISVSRGYSVAVIAAASFVVIGSTGFATDWLSGATGIVAVAFCVAASVWALSIEVSIHREFGLGTAVTSLASLAVVSVAVVGVIGRLHQHVDQSVALGTLSFFGGLRVALLAVAAIAAAIGSGRLVEAIVLAAPDDADSTGTDSDAATSSSS